MTTLKKYIFTPFPSLFDVCVGGFLFLPMLSNDLARSVFFIIYTLFLISISFCVKAKRQYKSLPLTLLSIWAILNIFIHSYAIYPGSITNEYLAYYILAEGFLYLFFGIMFLRTVAIYSTNLRYIYILLPFAIIPWYSHLVYVGSTTFIAALIVSVIIYLFFTKRFKLGAISLGIGLMSATLNWKWVCMKFFCRPIAWGQLSTNLFYHTVKKFEDNIVDVGIQFSPPLEKYLNSHFPVLLSDKIKPALAIFFGAGFPQYLNSNYLWVEKDLYGWLYRHNDLLALGNDLGIVALLIGIWFIIDSIRKIGVHPALIAFMAVVLTSMFQVTMYLPNRTGIYLLVGTLAITEGLKRRSVA